VLREFLRADFAPEGGDTQCITDDSGLIYPCMTCDRKVSRWYCCIYAQAQRRGAYPGRKSCRGGLLKPHRGLVEISDASGQAAAARLSTAQRAPNVTCALAPRIKRADYLCWDFLL